MTVLSRFQEILGDADFDIDDAPDGTNDADVIAYQQKIETLQEKVSGLGCLAGCMPEYLQCKRDNPSYPGQSICDTYLTNCLAKCGTAE